jgi:NTP pyrophosphatase (non-canonical NTP hydrolase)
MTYYIYHIPGKKIGVTRDLKYRVEEQQGYRPGEYHVILKSENIDYVSKQELSLQEYYGYKVDEIPYNKLKCNNMRINVTEQTTTFPCPLNKLKGQLLDNMGMQWETDHGDFSLTKNTVKWILSNAITSKYNNDRCYVYNKAFARYYDNNDPHEVKTRTGGLFPVGADHRVKKCGDPYCSCVEKESHFDLIRDWAEKRGLYNAGDPKTQTLKLMEEAGEICRAVLKKDEPEIIDGIGDCVVVLTNLAHLCDTSIEECIDKAYNEIKNRTGKMDNGTFKKD